LGVKTRLAGLHEPLTKDSRELDDCPARMESNQAAMSRWIRFVTSVSILALAGIAGPAALASADAAAAHAAAIRAASPDAVRHVHAKAPHHRHVHLRANRHTLSAAVPTSHHSAPAPAPAAPHPSRHRAALPHNSHLTRTNRTSRTGSQQALASATSGSMLATEVRKLESQREAVPPDAGRKLRSGRGPPRRRTHSTSLAATADSGESAAPDAPPAASAPTSSHISNSFAPRSSSAGHRVPDARLPFDSRASVGRPPVHRPEGAVAWTDPPSSGGFTCPATRPSSS
jgi:hypothetical protein